MSRLGDYVVPIHRGESRGFVEGEFHWSAKCDGTQIRVQRLPRICERAVLVSERGQEGPQGFGIPDLCRQRRKQVDFLTISMKVERLIEIVVQAARYFAR